MHGDLATLYGEAILKAREVARVHGYAIGVHGSQNRDLDLIAAPWAPDASSAEELVEAIALALGWYLRPNPTLKPHGRRAWSIFATREAYIDLSVMPRTMEV